MHSTPSTNASALPVDTTRAVFSPRPPPQPLEALPLGHHFHCRYRLETPERVRPDPCRDRQHRHAVAAHDAATNVRAAFNDINMNDEQRTQRRPYGHGDVAGRRHQPG